MPRPITPLLTVDALIADAERGVVLIRRGHEPFEGNWALPGGFVEVGETCEVACVREAREETGLAVEPVAMLGVYSDPARDPRGHTVSVVFTATGRGTPKADTDAKAVKVFLKNNLPGIIAFDHRKIISDYFSVK